MQEFIKAALIRAVRTMAQAAIAAIGSAAAFHDVNWQVVASITILAGILSVLTSIATGLPEVEEDDFDEIAEPEGDEDDD